MALATTPGLLLPVNLACPQVASGAPLVNNNNQGWVHFVVNF